MTLQQLRYVLTVADCRSMNKAARVLYISQPSLSAAVRELEEEIGSVIFERSNKGISVTVEGNEFLGYARQLMAQYQLMDERFLSGEPARQKFAVSIQHYSFAVEAFMNLMRNADMDEYELAILEVQTHEVIENVQAFHSEVGVLYMNSFNERVLNKILREKELEFVPLFDCAVYVYLWEGHPLVDSEMVSIEDLERFPCLSFEQAGINHFYVAEEVLSIQGFKKVIKASDRATALNLMKGINAFILCPGLICNDLNGGHYKAVPLNVDERMTIGYIKRKGISLSVMGRLYVEELKKYESKVL